MLLEQFAAQAWCGYATSTCLCFHSPAFFFVCTPLQAMSSVSVLRIMVWPPTWSRTSHISWGWTRQQQPYRYALVYVAVYAGVNRGGGAGQQHQSHQCSIQVVWYKQLGHVPDTHIKRLGTASAAAAAIQVCGLAAVWCWAQQQQPLPQQQKRTCVRIRVRPAVCGCTAAGSGLSGHSSCGVLPHDRLAL